MCKIRLVKVSDEAAGHKGFDERGCYGSECADACCHMGADVDRETYDLIMGCRESIEKKTGHNLDLCFEKNWSGEKDFLGHDSISTTVIDGTCGLHLPGGRGCALFLMYLNEGMPHRISPSTCRLYPLTWQDGELRLMKNIEPTCNCLDSENCGKRTLMETQKEAIDDIFTGLE